MSETGLPLGWVSARLEEVCMPIAKVGRSGYGRDRFRYIDIGSIDSESNRVRNAQWIDSEEAPSRARQVVRAGDTVYSTVRPYLRKIAIVPGDLDGHVASTGFAVLRPHEEIDARYLFYVTLTSEFAAQVLPKQRGVSYPAVREADVLNASIPIAPPAEQRRIVEVIEDHLSRLDVADGALAHAKVLAPLQARSLFTAATEGRVAHALNEAVPDFRERRQELWKNVNGRKKYKPPVSADLSVSPVVPDGWAVFSLEELTDPIRIIRYGILMPKVKEGGVVPYVEVKDLVGCSLREKELHLTSRELDEKFSGARIRSGDLVLAVRGSYDRSAVVPPSIVSANVSRDVARIAPLPGLGVEYLHLYLQSRFAQNYLKNHARGVAVKGVNIASIRSMPVVVPPPSVQRAIVEYVQQKQTVTEVADAVVARSARRSAALRRGVLSKAFKGQLVAQNPGDEHASVVIERIRAERDARKETVIERRTHRRRRVPDLNESVLSSIQSSVAVPGRHNTVQQEFEL